MSESVVHYSRTFYDVNGSFDAIECDIWSPKTIGRRRKHLSKRNVVMARNVTLQPKI